MKKFLLALIIFLAAGIVVAYNNLSLFVIQPIGAIPEGRTMVVKRSYDMPFIDSADAMCKRRVGKVSLLCRSMALGEVSKMKIYARLPYSEWLYLKSTGGNKYER